MREPPFAANKPTRKTKKAEVAISKTEDESEVVMAGAGAASNTSRKRQRTLPAGEIDIASFTRTAHVVVDSKGMSFAIGRPRTHIGKQGNHVTAWALIQRTVTNVLDHFPDDESDVRSRRLQLIKVINILIAINHNSSAEKIAEQTRMYESINIRISSYLEKRKEMLNREQKSKDYFAKTETLLEEAAPYQELLKSNTELKNLLNRDLLSEISGIFLEFFNKIPNISFPSQHGLNPTSDEGSLISIALRKLDRAQANYKLNILLSRGIVTVKPGDYHLLTKNLFFYPKVSDEAKGTKIDSGFNLSAEARDNNLETLAKVIARHILIIKTAYSFLEKVKNFDQDFINSVFAEWSLSKKEIRETSLQITEFIEIFRKNGAELSKTKLVIDPTPDRGLKREEEDNADDLLKEIAGIPEIKTSVDKPKELPQAPASASESEEDLFSPASGASSTSCDSDKITKPSGEETVVLTSPPSLTRKRPSTKLGASGASKLKASKSLSRQLLSGNQALAFS